MIETGILQERTQRPGKFEGEKIETVFYHERMMDGDGEFLGCGYTVFDVTDEEKETFKLENEIFVIYEDGNGFAYGVNVDEKGLEEIKAEIDSLEYGELADLLK